MLVLGSAILDGRFRAPCRSSPKLRVRLATGGDATGSLVVDPLSSWMMAGKLSMEGWLMLGLDRGLEISDGVTEDKLPVAECLGANVLILPLSDEIVDNGLGMY